MKSSKRSIQPNSGLKTPRKSTGINSLQPKAAKVSPANKISRFLLTGFLLIAALAYVVKFGGASMLRLYVQTGIGDCHRLAIFSTLPEKEAMSPHIDKVYLAELTRYSFPEIEICLPKNVKAIQGEISKVYYKKRPQKALGGVAYLVTQPPDFFVDHYPQIKKAGIKDDYEFIQRVMQAKVDTINDVTDAFFTVMKSLFTPDLGDQKNTKIVKFTIGNKRGFVTYNLTPSENYFDCNMLDAEKNFFKIYIKDKSALIDLHKFFTIVSTVKKAPIHASLADTAR